MKLYEFNINSGCGPRLIRPSTNSIDAGDLCKDRNHEENLFLLLDGTRLYYYVDTPHGYWWQKL